MDNKKDKIIASAISVFREKGIEKTKVSDIVKGAGIAQGTFYLYFSSKLAVMPSIATVMMEKTLKEIQQQYEPSDPFPKQLEQIIHAVFQVTSNNREIFSLMLAGMASSEHLKDWEIIYAPYYKWMSNFLEQAIQQKAIRSTISTDRTAVLLIGVIESGAEQSFLYSELDDDEMEQKKQDVLNFILNALAS
ncbi:TetR family transcriptional regulator [Virgibacillus sp. W0430]|uniref:TetR family transcriptional regulator n=1 Tax=Virgibacillus sp. W0430 TaxID=3391580 RepID=UPI003F4832C4